MSSAGLVYAHFGLEIISDILKKDEIAVSSNCLSSLFTFVYEGFVEEIDAIDNGIPMYNEGKPKYKIGTHLSARVHRINPEWNSPEPDSTDELFQKAMIMVGEEFKERVLTVSVSYLALFRSTLDIEQLIFEYLLLKRYKLLEILGFLFIFSPKHWI